MVDLAESEFPSVVRDALSVLVADSDRSRPGFRALDHLQKISDSQRYDLQDIRNLARSGDPKSQIDQFKFPLAVDTALLIMAKGDNTILKINPSLADDVAENAKALAAIMGKTLPSQALAPAS